MALAHKMATVGELIAAGARCYWRCHECKGVGDADLARIAAAKGADFVLCDRHPPCPTPGCTYWVTFYTNNGQVNVPLYTEAGLSKESDRRTEWLMRQPHGDAA